MLKWNGNVDGIEVMFCGLFEMELWCVFGMISG